MAGVLLCLCLSSGQAAEETQPFAEIEIIPLSTPSPFSYLPEPKFGERENPTSIPSWFIANSYWNYLYYQQKSNNATTPTPRRLDSFPASDPFSNNPFLSPPPQTPKPPKRWRDRLAPPDNGAIRESPLAPFAIPDSWVPPPTPFAPDDAWATPSFRYLPGGGVRYIPMWIPIPILPPPMFIPTPAPYNLMDQPRIPLPANQYLPNPPEPDPVDVSLAPQPVFPKREPAPKMVRYVGVNKPIITQPIFAARPEYLDPLGACSKTQGLIKEFKKNRRKPKSAAEIALHNQASMIPYPTPIPLADRLPKVNPYSDLLLNPPPMFPLEGFVNSTPEMEVETPTPIEPKSLHPLRILDGVAPSSTPVTPPIALRREDSVPLSYQATPTPPAPAAMTPLEILYNQGLQAFAQRNYAKANRLFQNAAALDPNSSRIQCAYGFTLLFQGDYGKAAAALLRGGELARKEQTAPLWALFISSKDFAYHQLKLTQFLKRNPDDPDAKTLMLLLAAEKTPAPNKLLIPTPAPLMKIR
ncbi:MAG: tetratricopeptide repeat protein [Candidatus Omnitrophota bacterium]